ncbi:hypothetical protein [Streptomyces sp. NPDC059262]|uniref:hypothetical protein n=1 Tax=Streptomyces sp. NPDC059262 TaxID=3346797 RepID=UPI00369416B6
MWKDPRPTTRRSAVERELTAGPLPDAVELRRQVTQTEELSQGDAPRPHTVVADRGASLKR